MPVKLKIIKSDSFKYKGIFDLNRLIELTDEFFDKRGYDTGNPIQIIRKDEKENGVFVMVLELKLNDYFKISGKLTFVYNVKKVKIKNEENGEEFTLDEGDVNISMEFTMEHDYNKKFDSYGIFSEVIRYFVENLFMKNLLDDAKKKVKEDVEMYKQTLINYFNLNAIDKVL